MNNYMKTIISGLKQWVSSQKSDWNQNDSSAANFIKNRPFYSEEKEKVLFSRNISAESAQDDVYGAEGLAYGLSFVVGQIYKITFDNVEYPCECKLLGSAKVFGNTMIVGEGEETEEPFFIGYNDNYGLCLFCLTEGTHSLSILGTVEEVHQIDKKFVPMPDLADVAHTGDYYDLQNTPYIPWDTVRYATSQSLTEGNRKIARNNIGAAAATDVNNLNTTVSSLNTTVSGLSTQIEDATDECITGLSVSGKVITYTRGNGSTGTITTQDTTYSNATTTAAGLMSAADKTKVDKIATNLVNGTGTKSLKGAGANYASGENAVALGSTAAALGADAIALGPATTASGYSSFAEGNYTLAFGDYSHAEGRRTLAQGAHSHAEGWGRGNICRFTSEANAAEITLIYGDITNISIGDKFYYKENIYEIIGKTTSTITLDRPVSSSAISNGRTAHIYKGYASGICSHAEGNLTRASGHSSHAEGSFTIASGDDSHSEGYTTIAASDYQHVQGKYNIEDSGNKYAHIVGNGISDTSRSNAHTLDWNGNAWFAGDIYVGGTSQDDAAAVEVALKSDLASLSAPTAISLTRIDEICNQTIYSTNEVTF